MLYQWAIIGAGPAGIAAVGKLLDSGVPPHEIVWIDPQFKVGDFGALWCNVPSNTKVKSFLKSLNAIKAFAYANNFPLNQVNPEETCDLHLMVQPLQAVTQHLLQQVHSIFDYAEHLAVVKRTWQIKLTQSQLSAKNVILATGAQAKTLSYPDLETIPLASALDKTTLKKHLQSDDTIAVFGSSHSAILALRNLCENNVKGVINFYRSSLRYAVYLKDWILFDDSGLKGPTADWARKNIDDQLPNNLIRMQATPANLAQHLPPCNKAIYAVGFERRTLPVIEHLESVEYIEQCGIIAPGLFGLGIAFPEAKVNPLGVTEYRVGLWKFVDYLERVMPIWLNYHV